MTDTVHIVAAHNPDAAPEKRVISGLVLPFNRPGHTSAGAVTVPAGVVTLPEDIGRVKLLRDHSTEPGYTPVGYATAAEVTDDGLSMSFKIAATADGDVALADVTEHVRDALSVELVNTQINEDGTLAAGELSAVALVPIPAFADARVSLVTAARATGPATESGESSAAPPPESVAPVSDNDTGSNPPTEQETPEMANAAAPAGLHAAHEEALTLTAAITAIGDLAGHRSSPELTAALSDITYSANPAVHAPSWLGKLWDGVQYQREIVPTLTQAPLTGMNIQGWRWKTRPEVDDYAGDKKAIPSNKVGTEPVTAAAKRLAAGWDIDRAYFDFGDNEFIEAFLTAAREDYALKTDERAAQAIIEYAGNDSTLTPTPQGDLLRAAAHARNLIKQATRYEPEAFLVNPDTMFDLFNVTTMDMPQYLDMLGVTPSKFIATPFAPEDAVIAYAKPAVTWYELQGSPIRVSAEHIANGGIDEAIFGYYATILNDSRGIVRVDIATADAGA